VAALSIPDSSHASDARLLSPIFCVEPKLIPFFFNADLSFIVLCFTSFLQLRHMSFFLSSCKVLITRGMPLSFNKFIPL
jgi:hypothetical protein